MPSVKLQCVASIACAALLVVASCSGPEGPKTEPVTGTVTLDGKALEGAQVVFVPKDGKGRAASGTTDAEGKFTLTTFNPQDGAVIGDYGVTISKVEGQTVAGTAGNEELSEEEKMKKAMEAYYNSPEYKNMGKPGAKGKEKDLVPAKYKTEATSGLTAQVKEGENNFDFPLTSQG